VRPDERGAHGGCIGVRRAIWTLERRDEMKKNEQERILARKLAREISKEELRQVAGGMPVGNVRGGYKSSSAYSCSNAGDNDDGGADD
jgi:hypothetical protein